MQANKFPLSVKINGKNYPVRTSFADWVSILEIADDPTLLDTEKTFMQLSICYKTKLRKTDIREAVDMMRWFMQCGCQEKRSGGNKRVIDFVFDWGLVVAGFMQQYGIDLSEKPKWQFWHQPLHWWKFMQLFNGLTEETQIVKIMGYRSINLAKIKDKESKKMYADLKRIYALPAAGGGAKQLSNSEILQLAIKKQREAKGIADV